MRQSAEMRLDERFDDLIASLGGFHRSWLIYLGIELGLFERLRSAGPAGLTPDELAGQAGCQASAVEAWAWAADAHDLVTLEDGRLTADDEVAVILLDSRSLGIPRRPVRPRDGRLARLGRDARLLPDRHARSATGPTATASRSSV